METYQFLTSEKFAKVIQNGLENELSSEKVTVLTAQVDVPQPLVLLCKHIYPAIKVGEFKTFDKQTVMFEIDAQVRLQVHFWRDKIMEVAKFKIGKVSNFVQFSVVK